MLENQNISKTLLYETGTTGFYISYRENEMRAVSVKYLGNFCTSIEPKQSNRTPRDDSTVRNWLFFHCFLRSQSGTAAAVGLFNIQEAKKSDLQVSLTVTAGTGRAAPACSSVFGFCYTREYSSD